MPIYFCQYCQESTFHDENNLCLNCIEITSEDSYSDYYSDDSEIDPTYKP